LGLRDDVDPSACTIGQLKYGSSAESVGIFAGSIRLWASRD
jgi:hypothetical protein